MLWLLKISALVYIGFGAFLYLAQRGFMYFPIPENHSEDHAVEYLDVDGGRLKIWVVNPGRAQAAIYFGGNGEDVYFNADDFELVSPERTVYLVNYRGYGGSTGEPSEAALFSDALAMFDHAAQRHARLAVVGRSLGSSVATYLASKRPVERLLLITPADSALAIAKQMYPVYPVGWLLKDRYESVRYAPNITAPVLVITAERDRIIPSRHSERLVDAFSHASVDTKVIADAGHNGLSARPGYWQAIGDFLGVASPGG